MPGLYETFYGNDAFGLTVSPSDEGYPTTETRALIKLACRALQTADALLDIQDGHIVYVDRADDLVCQFEWNVGRDSAQHRRHFIHLCALTGQKDDGSESVFDRIFRAVVRDPIKYNVRVERGKVRIQAGSLQQSFAGLGEIWTSEMVEVPTS